MGGDITVGSAVGMGSTFTLEAPLPAADLAPKAAAAALTGLRVLGVDDHEINRRVLSLLLEPLGVDLTLAADGADALEALEAEAFDVVLADVHMPGLSGDDVARRLRAGDSPNARIPIVALTGATGEREAELRVQAGMHHVLAKPIEPAALISLLSNLAATRGTPADVGVRAA